MDGLQDIAVNGEFEHISDKPRTLSEAPELHRRIDQLERAIMAIPAPEIALTHRFTPGMYFREIRVPAGSIFTSKIHKSEHPWVISAGVASIWIDGHGWQVFRAPHTGVTKPGTRRIFLVHEDLVWTTFHATNLTDPEEIEREIIEPHKEHIEGLAQPDIEQYLRQLEANKEI